MNKSLVLILGILLTTILFVGCTEQKATTTDQKEEPTVSISTDIQSGNAPLTVLFQGYADDDGVIKNLRWDFDDGSTSSIQNPTHTFEEEGTYQVTLFVQDNDGLTNQESIQIYVSAPENEPPTAEISTNKVSGSAPLTVKFTGLCSDDDGSIISYDWDFDDGTFSDIQNPTHTFELSGTYDVKFTIFDDDMDSDSDTITITVTETVKEGYSRANPAPIGSTLTFEDDNHYTYGDYKVRITLKEIIRGANANTMVEDANMFNDPPEEGKEYICAKIKFEYLVSSEDAQYSVSEYSFDAVSSEGVDYDDPFVVAPEPALDADLYQGSSTEGWAVYEVDENDDYPLLTFGRDWIGKGGLWFRMY